MKPDDVVISETATVPIAVAGHRIVNGSGDQTFGVIKLKLSGELIDGETDVHLTMAEPVLYAGSVLGANLDFLPAFYSLSPCASWAANDMDACSERLVTVTVGAYEVGAPDPEGQILGYWQRSKYAKLLVADMMLGGSEIATCILLNDISHIDLINGANAEVMTKGQILNPGVLQFHPSVKTENDRQVKLNQLRENGIDTSTQASSSTAAEWVQRSNKQTKPWT